MKGKGHGPNQEVERAKDFKGTLKKLFNSLGMYKIPILVVFLFAAASTVFAIIGPKVLGNATNEIFNGIVSKISGGSGIDFSKVNGILLTCLILYIVSAICNYIQSFIMSTVTQKYTYKLRGDLDKKIHKLPFKYFDSKTNGEVLSVITNDVDTLQVSFNQAITQAITSLTTVIGIVIMMLSINVSMTLCVLILIPISLVFMSSIIKKSQKHFKNNQEYLGHVNGNIEEMYSGHDIVTSFNATEKYVSMFNENNKKLYEAGWKSQFLSGLMHPIMQFIGNLGYVCVAILGGYLCIKGKINVGNIQSFISYTKNFTQPLTSLAQVLNQIQSMIASSERIFEFLESDEETFGEKELDHEVLGNVKFDHVSFGYDENKTIIKDFSLNVHAGEKVAIVGPTGAGKTTLVKLLMNFYKVNSGEITVDGMNINDYKIDELRKNFGMVLQDTWLYSGTIMENLKYGKLDASDEEVYKACKIANVDHFIRTLPDGYNMQIDEENANISQGQKQLLTIARAVLANSKILILDEATSSVDTRTEELIQDAMDNLMEGRTSFIIAHRLSTIKNADTILVIDNGEVVEMGNHNELLKKNGFYAKLYNSQFEV